MYQVIRQVSETGGGTVLGFNANTDLQLQILWKLTRVAQAKIWKKNSFVLGSIISQILSFIFMFYT